jgi:hypothetical protein
MVKIDMRGHEMQKGLKVEGKNYTIEKLGGPKVHLSQIYMQIIFYSI